MLESLERSNLFLVPLDDHRRWYRYHHLFGDVLHAHLLDERPDDACGAAPARQRLVRRRRRARAGDPARAGRRRRRPGRRARRARHPGAATRAARGGDQPLGRRAPRRRRQAPAGAGHRPDRRPRGEQPVRRPRPAARDLEQLLAAPGAPHVVVDQAGVGSPAGPARDLPRGAGTGRRRPGRYGAPRRARPGPRRRRRPAHARLGLRAARARVLDHRRPRGRPPGLRGGRGGPRADRTRRGRARVHHHDRRPRADPGAARRRAAQLRARAGAGRARRPTAAGDGRHARRAEPRGLGAR